jgi:hypothetical protein
VGLRLSRLHEAATPAVSRAAFLAVVVVLIVIAYYPFTWDPPRTVRNDVTRSSDGALRFGQMNYARTPGTPAWLPEARASGLLSISLQADPTSAGQHASIMMLASDFWHTDFAIGQNGSDLGVWLRRPGSDANGDPPFVLGGVFGSRQWVSVDVTVQHDQIRIGVDGRTRMRARVPGNALRGWGQGQVALGDEVHGGGPWPGLVRLAEVRTPGHHVDYVRPGALSIPGSYLYLPDHIEPFPPAGTFKWLTVFLDLLSFIPVGFFIVLARRPPIRPMMAGLLGVAIVLLLAAGKFLFHSRHTSLGVLIGETAGVLLGALLARRWHAVNAGSR